MKRRVKTPRVVLGFDSLEDAYVLEAAAREHGIPGRIIPTPSEVAAGCGHAWAAPAQVREELLSACEEHGLAYAGVFEVMMY